MPIANFGDLRTNQTLVAGPEIENSQQTRLLQIEYFFLKSSPMTSSLFTQKAHLERSFATWSKFQFDFTVC